jgi:hypothetical protein
MNTEIVDEHRKSELSKLTRTLHEKIKKIEHVEAESLAKARTRIVGR